MIFLDWLLNINCKLNKESAKIAIMLMLKNQGYVFTLKNVLIVLAQ